MGNMAKHLEKGAVTNPDINNDTERDRMVGKVREVVRRSRIKLLEEMTECAKRDEHFQPWGALRVPLGPIDAKEIADEVLEFRRTCKITMEIHECDSDSHWMMLFGTELYGIEHVGGSRYKFVDPELRKEALMRTSVSELEDTLADIQECDRRRLANLGTHKQTLRKMQDKLKAVQVLCDEKLKRVRRGFGKDAHDPVLRPKNGIEDRIASEYVQRKRREAIDIINKDGSCDAQYLSVLHKDATEKLSCALGDILYRFLCLWPFTGRRVYFPAEYDCGFIAVATRECGPALAEEALGLRVDMVRCGANIVAFLSPEWKLRAIDETPWSVFVEERNLAKEDVRTAEETVKNFSKSSQEESDRCLAMLLERRALRPRRLVPTSE